MADSFSIVNLPEHVLNQIFSYMSHSEISESREVCQTFNRVCSRLLTKAFYRVDRLHNQIQKNIKSQLPRKESERRNHALSRFVDILSALETRLSLLSMTYTKYIDMDLCCFIPGKVLDEMYTVLRRLQFTDSQPPRSYDLLQSLRDLSTMAMEHFEEHIVPILKAQMNDCTQSMYFSINSPSTHLSLNANMSSGPFASTVDMSGFPVLEYPWATLPVVNTPTWRRSPLKLDVQRVQSQMQMHSAAIATMTKEYREQKVKISEQSRMIAEQERKIAEQSKRMSELKAHMQTQEKTMEIVVSHLKAITGKELILPEPKPWDQGLWDWEHAPRPSTSTHDSDSSDEGLSEPSTSREPAFPKRRQYRHILAEAQARKQDFSSPLFHPASPPLSYTRAGRGGGEMDGWRLSEQQGLINPGDPYPSSPCQTQRLLHQTAQLIQSCAMRNSLPVCLDGSAPSHGLASGAGAMGLPEVKDPLAGGGSLLAQLTAAQSQLTKLYEEHSTCALCSQASDAMYAQLIPSAAASPALVPMTTSTPISSPAPSTSSGLCGREVDPLASPAATNQGLVNRVVELYSRLQNVQQMAADKDSPPYLPQGEAPAPQAPSPADPMYKLSARKRMLKRALDEAEGGKRSLSKNSRKRRKR